MQSEKSRGRIHFKVKLWSSGFGSRGHNISSDTPQTMAADSDDENQVTLLRTKKPKNSKYSTSNY